jgi:GT2 family glycosyltransferase
VPETRIAVLMTCHNRREKTLACLHRLFGQKGLEAALEVFLVDDGCSDGTAAAVVERFPAVRVLPGTGQLYWGGGMQQAFAAALAADFDHYLWLNDDTLLDTDALARLLAVAGNRAEGAGIVVGALSAPEGATVTYGGVRRRRFWQPLVFDLLPGSASLQRCDTFNGNCVLIADVVARRVGNIEGAFTHGLGDFDYGLRAAGAGFASWVAPGFVGVCARNRLEGSCRDARLPLVDRLQLAHRPTGLPPVKEWLLFARRHAGPCWPLYWLRTSVRRLFPVLWVWWRSRTVPGSP